MPTYEYACRDCGEHLDIVQSFKDDPLTECPVCGGQLRKVFSPIGIAFKGSGFYKNDSRKATGSSGASKDTAAIKDQPDNATSSSDNSATPAASDGGTGSTSSGDGSASPKGDSGASSKPESSATPPASTKNSAPKTPKPASAAS